MKRFTNFWRRRLAGTCIVAVAGLFLVNGEEPLKGGRFTLIGTTTAGGGRAGGGVFAVDGVAGQTSTAASSGGNFQVTGGLVGVVVIPGEVAITVETTADGMARLSWPSTAVGFQLEFAAQLGPQPDWKPVLPAPTGNVFSTPMNQPYRFFRLHKP